ncbi:hypothetical protein [Halothiobacillus sp. DCM-1]|uniref:hypothetical protein n=1 Tax=Halothiobacillus sp. DCM-1 TaxID=3112558 RepID=UPI0032542BCA
MSETPPQSPLTPSDIAEFIAHEQQQERRGDFVARPVQLQKLNQFGSPQLAVLTRESEQGLTVAGLMAAEIGDELVVYDDTAPQGRQILCGVVESVRAAHRPADAIKGMRLFYLSRQLVEQADSAVAAAAG